MLRKLMHCIMIELSIYTFTHMPLFTTIGTMAVTTVYIYTL